MPCLSFAGAAGNFSFHIGAAKALLQLVPVGDTITYAGVSSGSMIATMLAVGKTPDEAIEMFSEFATRFDRWYKTPITYWGYAGQKFFWDLLPEDAWKRVSGRLFIGYSALTITGFKARVVSQFTSNNDLFNAILTSCHVLPYKRLPFRWYRGELSCDGVFSNNFVRPPGTITVGITSSMIHANCFWSDWLISVEDDKLYRLHDAGFTFVLRHEAYFRSALHGAPISRRLEVKRFFNPLPWCSVLFILWIIWKYRRCLPHR